MMRLIALLLVIVLTALPAAAQEDQRINAPKPRTPLIAAVPEFCEFNIAFPSEPHLTERCDENAPDDCYQQISYTQVFDMDATVNFRAICNEIGSDIYDNYSGEVMEATLRAMTKKSVVQEFNASFRETEDYKQAGLVGEGKVGRTPTIYIAQLWIGKRSAFSVEAELIGNPNEAADNLFSDVLRSVRYKDGTDASSPQAEPDTESQTAPEQ